MEKKTAHYCGRLKTSKGPLAYFWLFEGDTASKGWKKQIAPAKVGEQWTFTFDKEGYPIISGEHRPVQTGSYISEDTRLEWSAREIVHTSAHQEEKMNKALLKRQDEFQKALAPIKRLLDTIDRVDERAFFINAVARELWRR